MTLVGSVLGPAGAARADEPCPGAEPCIVVHVVGSTQRTQVVSLADLSGWAELPTPAYQTRARPDRDPQGEPRPLLALSIRHLVEKLGLAPESVTFTEAPNRAGGTSVLRGATHDLDLPGGASYPFQDALMPAVFAIGTEAIGYIRPLRGGTDVNATDSWQTDVGGALELTVHTTGAVLFPTLSATPTTTKAGDPVAFAVALDPRPATTLSYVWHFGDGTTTTTSSPSVRHPYARPGTAAAWVTVTGADTSSGVSNAVTLTVGTRPPATPGRHRPGSGTGAPHAPATGPDHSRGTRAGEAPSSRPGAGGPSGSVGPTDSHPDASGSTSSTGSSSPTGGTPRPTGQVARTAPKHAVGAPRRVVAATGSDGSVVAGVLIGGPQVLALTGSSTAGSRASKATAPAARQGRGTAIGAGAAWAGLTVLLLGVGAVGEVRGVPRRRGKGLRT